MKIAEFLDAQAIKLFLLIIGRNLRHKRMTSLRILKHFGCWETYKEKPNNLVMCIGTKA